MKHMVGWRGRTRLLVLGSALLLAGCSDSGTGPAPQPPAIAVTGVQDGGTYDGPVTIGIAIDRGSYSATLNGAPFHSGTVVSRPGSYALVVTAQAGTAWTTEEVAFTIAAPVGGTLIIRVFDLGPNEDGGGGDAILVTDSSSAGQVHALIDAGPAGANASDPGYVARRLGQLGVDTLAFILLTHAHSDHFRGMTDVLNSLHVRKFYYNGQIRNLSFYNDLVLLARQRADTTIVPTDTIAVAFGMAAVQSRFTIVPPLTTYLGNPNAGGDDLNEGSLGTRLSRGGFSMFFTGDGEVEANYRWRTQFSGLTADVDVLKVGHHGANNAIFDDGLGTNSASAWLQHTSPEIAVISANGETHPRQRATNRLLQQSNMITYCTNVHGEITLRIWSDGNVHPTVERNANANCAPGAKAAS